MKIIAILDNAIGAGGGFDQGLNAINQMQRLSINRFDFEVFTTRESNLDVLDRLNIKATIIKITILDKFFTGLKENIFWYALKRKFRLISPLEKKLIKHKCDLVYFVTPSYFANGLQKLNYIFTLWDLSHIESPEFPEVRNFDTFFIREKIYQNNLHPAFLIITESKKLNNIAINHYGVDPDRFLNMPFSPTPFINKSYALNKNVILKKYNLIKNYFFYPAQFWAHKNHIRILQALLVLRDLHNWTPNVVFSGKDYGNLEHIKFFIKNNNLGSQVKLLGFVPSEDIRGLYENASALIMPTYFGPTNLPPLEAWSLGIPLIYPKHFIEHVKEAALLFDPDDSKDLANAMLLSIKPKIRKKLISKGFYRLSEINAARKLSENQLCRILKRFSLRRECWQ